MAFTATVTGRKPGNRKDHFLVVDFVKDDEPRKVVQTISYEADTFEELNTLVTADLVLLNLKYADADAERIFVGRKITL